MNDKNNIDSGSVNNFKPELDSFRQPLLLSCGRELVGFDLVFYETYGTLNSSQSNAILICHAYWGSSCCWSG